MDVTCGAAIRALTALTYSDAELSATERSGASPRLTGRSLRLPRSFSPFAGNVAYGSNHPRSVRRLSRSRSALRYTAEIDPDAAVTALHTVEPVPAMADAEAQRERCERKHEQARDLLEEARRVADDRSAEFSSEFVYGHPIHAILRYADLYTFDWIVMERCYQSDADATDGSLGNVTESIVRRTNVPITVTRAILDDEPIMPLESILVPFDGSLPSCNALTLAMETFPDAMIHVLYVQYPFVDDLAEPGVRSAEYPDFEDWYDAVRDWHEADRDAEDVLQIAETIIDDADADHQQAVEIGYPPRAILEYSERIDAEHVLIGSHGRSGIDRRSSEALLRQSPVEPRSR